MTTASCIWVLYADDNEMSAIEALLRECGEQIIYATVGGRRVHPGNAYSADAAGEVARSLAKLPGWRDNIAGTVPSWSIYVVEGAAPFAPGVRHIDHHRPGDPGYGVPPAEFLRGSSLGQVIVELARAGIALDDLPGWSPVSAFAGDETDAWYSDTSAPGTWDSSLRLRLVGWRHTARSEYARMVRPPAALCFVAAADHCLGAAYAGQCPGVDVEAFGEWRIATRAAHRERTDECTHQRGDECPVHSLFDCPPPRDYMAEVRADIGAATRSIRHARGIDLRPYESSSGYAEGDWFGALSCTVCDLRGEEIPELPEAACRLGVAYIATPKPGPDGRRKVVLQCASAEHLAAWPAWAAANGIVDCYGGDPARGFAGGYLA